MSLDDRRRSQRFDKNLPFSLDPEKIPSDIPGCARTMNISEHGALIEVNHFVEPFTKIYFSVHLPVHEEDFLFDCEAVVVRTVPDEERPGLKNYQLGLYFQDPPETSVQHLKMYLNSLE